MSTISGSVNDDDSPGYPHPPPNATRKKDVVRLGSSLRLGSASNEFQTETTWVSKANITAARAVHGEFAC